MGTLFKGTCFEGTINKATWSKEKCSIMYIRMVVVRCGESYKCFTYACLSKWEQLDSMCLLYWSVNWYWIIIT